jgi:hypothetical protein
VSDIPIFREVGGDDVWTIPTDASADTIASTVLDALAGKSSRLYRHVLSRYRWDVIVDQGILPLLPRSEEGLPTVPTAPSS